MLTTDQLAKLCKSAPGATMLKRMACIHASGGDKATMDMDAIAATFLWTGDKHFEFKNGTVKVQRSGRTEVCPLDSNDRKCQKAHMASQLTPSDGFRTCRTWSPSEACPACSSVFLGRCSLYRQRSAARCRLALVVYKVPSMGCRSACKSLPQVCPPMVFLGRCSLYRQRSAARCRLTLVVYKVPSMGCRSACKSLPQVCPPMVFLGRCSL